jgi:hypothetical protein
MPTLVYEMAGRFFLRHSVLRFHLFGYHVYEVTKYLEKAIIATVFQYFIT